MPLKEYRLLAKDIGFYVTGKADVCEANWHNDPWLYPLDWSYQLKRPKQYFEPFDSEGIPLREFRGLLGKQYLVSRIAAFAIANWNQWRSTKLNHFRETFFRMSDWFVRSSSGRYEHQFPVAGMGVPWISCISQGEASSVLCRAFVESGDRRYLECARKSLQPLFISVAEGGLKSSLPDGGIFFEEYPGTKFMHVLNGCLYAAVGLHDFTRVESPGDYQVTDLLASVVGSIGRNSQRWDLNGWSIYDFRHKVDGVANLNTMTYQVLQAILLKYLGTVLQDSRLMDVGNRWEQSSARLPTRLNACRKKLQYRLSVRW